jgi:peptide/nickel transport system ATP-binding protein
MLSIRGLQVAFTDDRGFPRNVVNDLSFEVGDGERVALIGESGSGKTLTALSIPGLLPAGAIVNGGIRFQGRELASLSEGERRQLCGGRIGVVFQDALSAFNPVRTIGSLLVESARRHARLTRTKARQRAAALLGDLGVPSPERRLAAYPHELSGGQRQRCMIALAMINDPPLLIADEPTTSLDATVQAQILDLLDARSQGRTLLFITHDLNAAVRLCDRALLMKDGEIVEEGVLPGLLETPASDYGRALVASAPRNWTAAKLRGMPATVGEGTATGERLLSCSAVAVTFPAPGGPVHALRGVDLTVGPAEIIALVGESGCGKSSLARVLAGIIEPNAGSVAIEGSPVGSASERSSRERSAVQYVFQDPFSSLDPRWPAVRSVAEPLTAMGMHDAPFELAAAALERVGIPRPMHERLPADFSGGQRQRIAIARALVCNPRVIVADEPLSALDMSIQKQVVDILVALREQQGLAIVLISHDLELVGRIADRIIVMYLGKIVEEGEAASLLNSPDHPYTRQLLAASRGDAVPRGDIASAMSPPRGCAFVSRCPLASARCHQEDPPLRARAGGGRVACLHSNKGGSGS